MKMQAESLHLFLFTEHTVSEAVCFVDFFKRRLLFQYVKNGHNKHLDLFTNRDGGIILWHSGEIFALEMGEKTMKKRIITVLLTLALLIPFVTPAAYAGDLLESKATYYTDESDYMDGDCILTATRMMIRRAAIMRGKVGWSNITNASLRPEATMDGLLLYSFSYKSEGATYNIASGSFTGHGSYARIGEFESLLNAHPEGIVVWGIDAANTGTHGVLVVKVENGTVYAMDSSYNMGCFKEGIQKWTDTTMLDPSLVTDYWYISEITPDSGIADSGMQNSTSFRARHFKMLRMRITTV